MSGKPSAPRPARSSISADREPASSVDAAIDEVVRLTLELTSAIGKLAYADAVRARNQLSRALSRAQRVVASLPGVGKRALALHRFDEIRPIAARQLEIAPVPSSAAIAAAEAGLMAPWNREARAWIASRRAGRTSARSRRRRTHRDTRPDAPNALRETSGGTGDAAAAIPNPIAANPSPEPTAGEAGTQ